MLYKDKRDLLQGIYGRITDEIIREAVKEKDGNIAKLINNLGYVMSNLGDAKKAIEYYSKALEIDLAVFGNKHPKVATYYNNLGAAWSILVITRRPLSITARYWKFIFLFLAKNIPMLLPDITTSGQRGVFW